MCQICVITRVYLAGGNREYQDEPGYFAAAPSDLDADAPVVRVLYSQEEQVELHYSEEESEQVERRTRRGCHFDLLGDKVPTATINENEEGRY
jgi:hypothetical protein